MTTWTRTTTRTGVGLAVLAVAVLVAAWTRGSQAAPPRTPSSGGPPSASATGSTAPGSGAPRIDPATLRTGSDGLTVRYLDRNGKVQTLPVEDFRR